MAYLTPDTAPDSYRVRRIIFPDGVDWLAAISGALAGMITEDDWRQFGAITQEEAAQEMFKVLHSWWYGDMIGEIVYYCTMTPPAGVIPADGSMHLRTDYPALYDAIHPAFHVDSERFLVPDLRGCVIVGAGQGPGLTHRILNDIGGAEVVTLTTNQMPAHTHTSPPHTHTEITAVTTIINGGVEAPAQAAVPAAGTTGTTAVTIDTAGGGAAHENMPPFIVLFAGIRAR